MWCIQHGDTKEKGLYHCLLEIAHLRRQKGQEKNLELKVEMIKEYESGTFKQTELASKYGVGKSTVSDILKQRARRVEKGMGKWE